MKQTLRMVIGILLISIGLIGLVAPIIPGIPLLFIGMELVGIGFLIPQCIRRWIRNLYQQWKDRKTT